MARVFYGHTYEASIKWSTKYSLFELQEIALTDNMVPDRTNGKKYVVAYVILGSDGRPLTDEQLNEIFSR